MQRKTNYKIKIWKRRNVAINFRPEGKNQSMLETVLSTCDVCSVLSLTTIYSKSAIVQIITCNIGFETKILVGERK